MGSFNTTCFASHQTIASDDPCRVLPIWQQSTYSPVVVTHEGVTTEILGCANTTCYVDCFWTPVGTFIPCSYDDYGQVKFVNDDCTAYKVLAFFRCVLNQCPTVQEGSNSSHDLPFDFPEFVRTQTPGLQAYLKTSGAPLPPYEELCAAWDYIWDVGQENRLFIKDEATGTLRPLQFAIIHEDAYQALLASATPSRNLDAVLETISRSPLLTGQRETRVGGSWILSELVHKHANKVRGGGGVYYVEEIALEEACFQWEMSLLEDATLMAIVRGLLADQYVSKALDGLNLRFSPFVYAGQDYHNEIGQEYAQFVTTVSQKVSRRRLERYYESYYGYQGYLTQPGLMEQLKEALSESDAALDSVQWTPEAGTAPNGVPFAHFRVTFEATLPLDELIKELAKLENGDAFAKTLVRTAD